MKIVLNTRVRQFWMLWGVAFALFSGAVRADHVSDANALVNNLLVSKQNVYGSNPSSIVWNGTSSQAKTVCATFVTLLLQHSYNWNSTTFQNWMGTNSPNAALYHDSIVAQNGFTRIDNVSQIHVGDILAAKYYDDATTSSGHVMVANGVATLRNATAPMVPGTTQYDLPVIDSTKSYHGTQDTRYLSGVPGGIGRGTLRLYADANGTIAGYCWSDASDSIYYLPSARDLVVGRLK